MTAVPRGLRPHTHEERRALAERLVPLFERKFGAELRAVAACASFARGADGAYSDLELVVFVDRMPAAGEERGLQRIVGGLLVEAEYVTAEEYVRLRTAVARDWHLAASDVLLPLHNAPFVEEVGRRCRAAAPPREELLAQAATRFVEVQEACGKVLTAIERGHAEPVGLLLFDAVLHTLAVLALLNARPYTTFASFIAEARAFPVRPDRYEELLDRVVAGDYRDLGPLRELLLAVFAGFERLFAERGVRLYDEDPDPGVR